MIKQIDLTTHVIVASISNDCSIYRLRLMPRIDYNKLTSMYDLSTFYSMANGKAIITLRTLFPDIDLSQSVEAFDDFIERYPELSSNDYDDHPAFA